MNLGQSDGDSVPREKFEAVQQNCRALYAQRNRYREALEWIADDVDEAEMRKWAQQALAGEPLTDRGR